MSPMQTSKTPHRVYLGSTCALPQALIGETFARQRWCATIKDRYRRQKKLPALRWRSLGISQYPQNTAGCTTANASTPWHNANSKGYLTEQRLNSASHPVFNERSGLVRYSSMVAGSWSGIKCCSHCQVCNPGGVLPKTWTNHLIHRQLSHHHWLPGGNSSQPE